MHHIRALMHKLFIAQSILVGPGRPVEDGRIEEKLHASAADNLLDMDRGYVHLHSIPQLQRGDMEPENQSFREDGN